MAALVKETVNLLIKRYADILLVVILFGSVAQHEERPLTTPVQVMWTCSPSLTRPIVLSGPIGKTSLRPSSMRAHITLMPRVKSMCCSPTGRCSLGTLCSLIIWLTTAYSLCAWLPPLSTRCMTVLSRHLSRYCPLMYCSAVLRWLRADETCSAQCLRCRTVTTQLCFLLSKLFLEMKYDATDRFMRDTILICHFTKWFVVFHHTMHDHRPEFSGNTIFGVRCLLTIGGRLTLCASS